MPRGPKGQKRPADGQAAPSRVMEVATGQAEEEYDASDAGKDQGRCRVGPGRARRVWPIHNVFAFSLDFVTLMNRGQGAPRVGACDRLIASLDRSTGCALRLMRVVLR